MRRRGLLGCVSAVAFGPLAGCLSSGDDGTATTGADGGISDWEIHQVVREWETDRTFSLEVAAGEFLVVAIDTRRPVPGRTSVSVFDAEDRPVATYHLSPREPTVTHEVQMDGRYGVLVTPEDQDRQPVRVWIRITATETPPETRLERRVETIVDDVDDSTAARVRTWDLDDSRLFVAIERTGDPDRAVMAAACAYADGVAGGLDLPFEGVIVDPEGNELARFEIAVAWARSYASGTISRDEYLARVFETVD